jgi:hypothetical protein
VENHVKAVSKAVDMLGVNESAIVVAVVGSVLLKRYPRKHPSAEKMALMVVAFSNSESPMFTPLGKCTSESSLDVTIHVICSSAVVQLTKITTFSVICAPSGAWTKEN